MQAGVGVGWHGWGYPAWFEVGGIGNSLTWGLGGVGQCIVVSVGVSGWEI